MKLLSPFYGKHVEYGGKFMAETGWQLPTVYTSVEEEYLMVKERAGFIDYGLQRALAVVGRDAFNLVQKVLVNDLRKISPGKAIYSSMVDKTGKVLDDEFVFWVEEDFFIFNTLSKALVMEWLKKHAQGLNVYIMDTGMSFLAFQGPKTRDILQKAMNVKDLPYLGLKRDNLGEIPVLISRAGFTGELGYELFVLPEYGHALWGALVDLGKDYKVGPYGLDAGWIFAAEKGYVWGADFYEGSTPLEVGLGWTVGFDKEDFIGKEALLKRRNEGLKTKLMGFEVSDPKVVTTVGDNLLKGGKVVGKVTTIGVYSPALKKSLGRGWVEIQYANVGEELEVEHENRKTKVKLAKKTWCDPEDKKLRA